MIRTVSKNLINQSKRIHKEYIGFLIGQRWFKKVILQVYTSRNQSRKFWGFTDHNILHIILHSVGG